MRARTIILDALSVQAATVDQLCGQTGYARGTVGVALAVLKRLGRVEIVAKYPRGTGHGSGAPTALYRVKQA